MKFIPGNAQHIGKRKEQQDAFAFSNPADEAFAAHGGLLAVVADGMGGLANGRQASTLAVRTFLAEYERKSAAESVPNAMDRAFRTAFRAVEELNQRSEGQTGSTLVAAAARGGFLYWLAIGDSHLYLVRDDSATQLNRDHTFGERLLDQVAEHRMERAEALAHPERAHLTSYLGMEGAPLVDRNIRPFRLEPGDHIVLCSDGIYRSVSENELVQAFQAAPRQACETIKNRVLARRLDDQDNLTIAAFRCDDTGAALLSTPRRRMIAAVVATLLAGADIVAGWGAWRAIGEQRAKAGFAAGLKSKRPDRITPADSSKSAAPPARKAISPESDRGRAGSPQVEKNPGPIRPANAQAAPPIGPAR